MNKVQRVLHTLSQFGAAMRGDGWENPWTGLGTARDRTTASIYQPTLPIMDPELSALYHGDDVAKRVVNLVPREMLRPGFGVGCPDQAAVQVVSQRAKDLDTIAKVKEAMIWGRCFGGSVILIGADDGRAADLPLYEEGIRSLSFLQVYDRRMVWPHEWEKDPRSPWFNQPSVYRLTNFRTGWASYVHASRVIRFGGEHTGEQERYQLNGWDYSVLQHSYDTIRAFNAVYKAAEYMMGDASQGVFKMRGLLAMIAGGQLVNLQTRAQFLDMTRGIMRAVMLDADGGESFEKVQTAFAGVGDVLDRLANRLAACSETPVTLLMGQAPAGLNATGASDIRAWYDRIEGDREQKLKPVLERLVRLISLAEGLGDRQFKILFRPLWQETAKEKADRELVEAQTANIWITTEVLTPEQVAVAKFGSDEPQPYRVDPTSLIPDPSLGEKDIPGGVPKVSGTPQA